jgi:hypothetical protein
MGIIKKYHDKKWTLKFLDALYNSIDIYIHDILQICTSFLGLKTSRWNIAISFTFSVLPICGMCRVLECTFGKLTLLFDVILLFCTARTSTLPSFLKL